MCESAIHQKQPSNNLAAVECCEYCLIIPHFNHVSAFSRFLERLLPIMQLLKLRAIVVDDGSTEAQSQQLRQLLEKQPQYFVVLSHQTNRGKGAALITGCYHARTLGYTHVLQIDADGQHDVDDIVKFIRLSQSHPQAIISGQPYFDRSAPKLRVYGRRVTDFWVMLETLSLQIKDGLCGFRAYPLAAIETVLDHYHVEVGMAFDTEILVKAVWHNIPLCYHKTLVRYPEQGVSHFQYWRDNWRLIRLHARLILGMLWRLPYWILRKLRVLH